MASDLSPRLAQLPTWQLTQASAHAHRVLHERLALAGASGYEYRLLAALGDGGPASQADLGRAAALDRRDVTDTVRGLEARGLVNRRPHPGDARRTLVALIAAGSSTLAGLDVVLQQVQDEVLAPLTVAQRRTLAGLLQRLS